MRDSFRIILTLTIIGLWSCRNSTTDKVSIDLNAVDSVTSENVSYKIENKDFSQKPIKASFDLRIEKKISEDQIRNVAKTIMTEYPGFKKYFIFYLLPDMEIGKEHGRQVTLVF